MLRLARRLTQTSAKSYGMFAKAAALGPRPDLIHLELGMPIHDTPDLIKEATVSAMRAGHVHYTHFQGIPELRNALAVKMHEQNALDFTADEIIVTNGLTQASFIAFMALLDEGDEAILLDPYYPQHLGKIEMAGAKAVIASTGPGFTLVKELIEEKITPRTRVITLVNPSNPTGRCYSREELTAVAELAQKYDLAVICDEVYERITFDGTQHISIASLPGMRARTITMFAFTKAFAMDGWRIGWLAADKSLIGSLVKLHATEVTHVNTFIQHGALAAITAPPEVLGDMVDDDRMKRDLVVSRLNQMPGVTCELPQGTIYAFPDISGTGLSAQQAADALLNEAQVVVEAGTFYGKGGEGHLRVCFGSETTEKLTLAMDRMTRFFNNLPQQPHS
ncbi:aminotransferase class I/II-fold pyridoxal phosphate-dependent enzyme [Tianweitania sp. BSSL-BM11]|uniref:aspartate transaminase n=1 Tax=Tianweitania aestuarii TaxID=2814886 RepID=A0ABS5RXT9_9HYPH|nr:aminotransferase class I/II-fold pyridoxal phosphate-dependent enzyme [Tianweitania aestuarii]MBS9721854.1 aminotransferase class I/II-fold pyridoxal phosphate-dependent enzyme [Tianweitania aestuarii]